MLGLHGGESVLDIISYAVLVICAFNQTGELLPESGEQTSARALYEQAATAIETRDYSAAIEALEALQLAHSTSIEARTSRLQLAECYLLIERPTMTLESLNQILATEQQLPTHQRIAEIDLIKLSKLGSRALPENTEATECLERHLASIAKSQTPHGPVTNGPVTNGPVTNGHAPPSQDLVWSKHQAWLYLEIARRHEQLGHYQAAQAALLACRNLDPASAVNDADLFRIQLAWARQLRTGGEVDKAIALLSELAQSPEPQLTAAHSIAISLELVELQLLRKQYEAALTEIEETIAKFADADEQSGRHPEMSSLRLRHAELLVLNRRYQDAEVVLTSARERNADFDLVGEFDFLLARCAIAQVDFPRAIAHLQAITESPSVTDMSAAKALWMQGEVHFMQRDYASALARYAQVTGMEDAGQYVIRAHLQAGKCYELLGQPLEALAAYERVLVYCTSTTPQESGDGAQLGLHLSTAPHWTAELIAQATERIAVLKPNTNLPSSTLR
ncbi:MAG: tetratricopeptide repeat protein [Pirellulaceae bacterium]